MIRFAAHQPNFCPWIGYFAKLQAADVFVVLDDVQMPGGQSYVSRSKIRGASPDEAAWLSVPIRSSFPCLISEVALGHGDGKWRQRHLNLLRERYRKALHFAETFALIEACYAYEGESLAGFNLGLLRAVMEVLDIRTPLKFSSEIEVSSTSDQRLADIGVRLGAEEYVSGAGADAYQSVQTYARSGIRLAMMEVKRTPDPIPNIGLSIIDHLMTVGAEATKAFLAGCQPVPVVEETSS